MDDKKLEILLTAIVNRLDLLIEQQNSMIEGLTIISELLEIEEDEERQHQEEEPTEEEIEQGTRDLEEQEAQENEEERKTIKTKFKKRE